MKNINREKKQKIQRLLTLLILIKAKVVVTKQEKEEPSWIHEITSYYLENDWENTMSGPMSDTPRNQHIEFDPMDVWRNRHKVLKK